MRDEELLYLDAMAESSARPEALHGQTEQDQQPYRTPTVEVISLDCEISAYAPDDGDIPLF